MVNRECGIRRYQGIIILLLMSLLLIPVSMHSEKVYGESEEKSESKSGYELTVKDDLISLNAEDALLKEIIGEIGTRLQIEVVGNAPEDEKISIEFDRLPLEEALEKISSNYGYTMDAGKEENKIVKIIVLPKGEESRIQETESTVPVKNEPFKFEFNPMEYMEAGG